MAGQAGLYSIILPVYNEEENLPIVTYHLFKVAKQIDLRIELIVVEDNSTDRTRELAVALEKFYSPHVKLILRPGKMGLGSAYQAAFAESKGDRVIIMDADMSHDPKAIPSMIAKMAETSCDVVFGSRYCEGGGIEGWNFFRKLTSRVANFLTTEVLRVDVSDFTGSFRLYKREVLERLIGRVENKGYGFQMEMIVRTSWAGYKVEEVPIVFVDRVLGASKFGPGEVKAFLRSIWNLFITSRDL